MNQKKIKSDWISVAKGIAIILVVYRHNLIGMERSGVEVHSYFMLVNEMVFSFRMPLFFIISGLFISKSIAKRENSNFVGYKFNSIIYPYLVWGLIQISIQIVFSNYTNSNRGILDYLYLIISPRQIDQFWYLHALFNCSVLFYLTVRYIKPSNYIHISIALILFGLSSFIQKYDLFHDIMYYYLFLVIGHCFKDFLLQTNYSWRYLISFFIFLTPFFWYSQWYWLNNPDINIYIFAIIAVLGTLYVFIVARILAGLNFSKVLIFVGQYSLQIYLMHVMALAPIRIFFLKIVALDFPILVLFTGWVAGTFVPIIFYLVVKKTVLNVLFVPPWKGVEHPKSVFR